MGSLYAIVLGAIVLSLLGVSVSRLGKVKTRRIIWWRGGRCRCSC